MIIFIIALSVSLDLGFNFLYNLVPGRDGIAAHSFVHAAFGIFGDRGWTLERFYGAFEKSVWVTFLIMLVSIALNYTRLLKGHMKPGGKYV